MTETGSEQRFAAEAVEGEHAETAKLRDEIALLWALDLGDAEMAVTFTPLMAREE